MSRYIDADVLLAFIKKDGYVDDDDCQFECPCEMNSAVEYIENYIKEMPTADVVPIEFHERCIEFEIKKRANMVERKQGKNISKDGFLCSVCTFGDFGGFHGYEPNFCPNCGARMDERRGR